MESEVGCHSTPTYMEQKTICVIASVFGRVNSNTLRKKANRDKPRFKRYSKPWKKQDLTEKTEKRKGKDQHPLNEI